MKKPKLEDFTEALRRAGGNVSRVADFFGVSRVAAYDWIKKDPKFKKALDDQRGRTLDALVNTALSLAHGIPLLKDGKRVGWKEEPNWRVLTYLIGKLGQNEGFGDKVDITSNGESIKPEPVTIRFVASREDLEKINQEVPDLEK